MTTRMLKLASCSAGLLSLSVAMLSGCAGSGGGCKSCGSHGGAGPVATSPYPGASGTYAAAAPAAVTAQASGGSAMPYPNQSARPYAAAPYPSVPGAYAAAAPAAMPAQAPGGSAVPYQSARSYGGQKTCPVTGEGLGSMGPAIPVAVNGETIYVCCEGCVNKVQRNPDSFIAKAILERAGQ